MMSNPIVSAPTAIYVHIPFCPSKCHYCDFNSYKMDGEIQAETIKATINQIQNSPWVGTPAKTIFIGGGTPTYIETKLLNSLLETIMANHPPIDGCEITSESNPGTITQEKMDSMINAGFNRISLGAQSFNPDDLIRLGRVHNEKDIELAVEMARNAGFNNINLDLIFGLSYQKLSNWEQNVKRAINLNPEHLSLYGLTIEKGTQFYKLFHKGNLPLPQEEEHVAMYNAALELATGHGYNQYEISNFSKPGMECKHNICYWNGENYIAYGPGAVGCMPISGERIRYTNIKHPVTFVEASNNNKSYWYDTEIIDEETAYTEKVMLGMRMNHGVVKNIFKPEIKEKLQNLQEKGWITLDGERVQLTDEGRMISNEVIVELL